MRSCALSAGPQAIRLRASLRLLSSGELRGEGVLDGPVDGKAALTKYRAARHSRSLRFGGHITEVVCCTLKRRTFAT